MKLRALCLYPRNARELKNINKTRLKAAVREDVRVMRSVRSRIIRVFLRIHPARDAAY